ncbi:MAG: fasciclin domain-containing protein, partial [Actinomycetota bacterium]|nr:fasciclin domain-containing protein [Actinomycetota bacterium]
PTTTTTTLPPTTTTTTLPPTTTTTTAPPTTVPEKRTAWKVLRTSPDLSKARRYIDDAGLRDALDDPDMPLTFLAPDNDAFTAVEKSPGGSELLGNRGRLRKLLLRHIVDRPLSEDDLFSNDELRTAGGDVLEVDQQERTIEDASVIDGDLGNGGGVVHAIDLVLLP